LFAVVIAPIQGGLGLVLALLVNSKLRGVNIFRTVYFTPVVTAMVVIAILWSFILSPDQSGLMNRFLSAVSGRDVALGFLGDSRLALPSIMLMSIWQGVGFHMVVWLSGLQTIPGGLYEAASIDGANAWQQFKAVTWPGLRPTAIFVLITITIAAFGLFTQVDVLTNGGPLDATQTMIYQAVEKGFDRGDMGAGTAISVFFFFFVLSIALIQRYLTREDA
jgi:ABC-type sugar transport system permease subunit